MQKYLSRTTDSAEEGIKNLASAGTLTREHKYINLT